jgi:hypothetical protein
MRVEAFQVDGGHGMILSQTIKKPVFSERGKTGF